MGWDGVRTMVHRCDSLVALVSVTPVSYTRRCLLSIYFLLGVFVRIVYTLLGGPGFSSLFQVAESITSGPSECILQFQQDSVKSGPGNFSFLYNCLGPNRDVPLGENCTILMPVQTRELSAGCPGSAPTLCLLHSSPGTWEGPCRWPHLSRCIG